MRSRASFAILSAFGAVAACGGSSGDHEQTGVYAIPLSTPSNADQGSFYTPMVTVSGSTFLLDLDTGSTDTAIAGSACSSCTGLSPLYAPGASAKSTGGSDSATYADESGWSGSVYTDEVALGNGTPAVGVNLVDIDTQSMFFSFSGTNEYQGILGMGPDELLGSGTTSYFDAEVAGGVADIMAYELCPTDGTMWFGGYDATHAASDLQYTPILGSGDNAGFYSVPMESIALGGSDLGATAATLDGPIVDTGTSLFYIPTATQTALVAALNNNAKFAALFPGQTLTDPTSDPTSDTAGCVTAGSGVTDSEVDSQLPALDMTFGGVDGGSIMLSSLPLASYLLDVGGGQFCLATLGGGDDGQATLGDTFMRGFVTEIDRSTNQVGFAPTAHCAAPDVVTPRGRMRERGRGPNHRHPRT